nr:AMP-binding protein [uncultured Cupriavidus sp.]
MHTRPWLASYGDIPATIDADAVPSLVVLLDEAMQTYAARRAFTCDGLTMTYAEVDAQSRALAAWLQSVAGVRPGDRVAVMLPNVLAFPVALIAIARIGAIQVNVNPMYTASELEHQLHDADAQTIIAVGGAADTLARVLPTSGVRSVVTVGADDAQALLPNATPFGQAIAQGRKLRLDPVEICGNDLLFLQYTGGTTGVSKGAALSHRNLIANIAQFEAIFPGSPDASNEVVVTAIPLYHIFALTVNFLSVFIRGGHNWLVSNPRDMDGFIDILKASRCTFITGVNTLFAALAAHPRIGEVDFSCLRLSAGGGAAIIPATAQKWLAITGSFIREGYGLSETSPIVTFNPQSVQAYNGTAGLPLPSTDVRLIDDDGRDMAAGEAGEICVKGPQVMQGYWRNPDANARAFTDDGYFKTGDIGVLTPDGFLKIVDRKKDMVIVSGFNVFPNEVEAVVSACPGVLECACIGIPDAATGEALKVYVVVAPNTTLDAVALQAHCRGELTAYKVPRDFDFVRALPKSTVGKVLRRSLRDGAPIDR